MREWDALNSDLKPALQTPCLVYPPPCVSQQHMLRLTSESRGGRRVSWRRLGLYRLSCVPHDLGPVWILQSGRLSKCIHLWLPYNKMLMQGGRWTKANLTLRMEAGHPKQAGGWYKRCFSSLQCYLCLDSWRSQRLCTCGFFRVVAHEAEPTSFFLTVAKQIEEAHFPQLDLKTVQVLQTNKETDKFRAIHTLKQPIIIH